MSAEGVGPNLSAWRNKKQLLGLVGQIDDDGKKYFPPREGRIVDLSKLGNTRENGANGNGNGHSKEEVFASEIVYQAPQEKEPSPVEQ